VVKNNRTRKIQTHERRVVVEMKDDRITGIFDYHLSAVDPHSIKVSPLCTPSKTSIWAKLYLLIASGGQGLRLLRSVSLESIGFAEIDTKLLQLHTYNFEKCLLKALMERKS
jgi:hypothetical protein